MHTSQLEFPGLFIKVQCSHVHIAVSDSSVPALLGIGGKGEAPGPTNEVCLELDGDGPIDKFKWI